MPDVNGNQSQPASPVPVPPPQPDQTPAPQPSAPAVPGSVNPAPQAPSAFVQNTQNPNPARPSTVQPSLHARVFDGILKGLTGGDRKVVNPDGSVTTVPTSRASMGKAIIAAALTGLMTPSHYRDTPFGPARDFGGDVAAAGAAGAGVMDKFRNAPQQLSDEQQARRLMTTQNNSKLLQLKMSMMQMRHARMEDSKSEINDFLKPFNDYQQEKSNDQPEAFLKKGMTYEQALAEAKNPGSGLTEANFVQDGWIPAGFDPETHEQQWQPSYAVVNPALKDIKLSEDVAKRLSEMNSQFQDIHKVVGGDVRLPVNSYVSAMHDYEALTGAEHVLDRLNESLHPDDAKAGTLKPIDIAPLVRNSTNRPQLMQALYGLHQTIASGVTGLGKGTAANPAQPTEGENPAHALSVLLNQAPELLKPLGLSTADAEDRINNWRAVQQTIKNQGKATQIADDTTVNGLIAAAKQLPEDQQKTVLPGLEVGTTTKADAQKAQTQIAQFQRANQSNATKQALQNGDPTVAAATAKNILDGAYANVKDLASMRGNAREVLQNAVIAEAQARGLDISKWGEAALTTKTNMYKEYRDTNKNKVGANIVAFRTFLDHADDALQANETWRRANSPLLNKPISWLAQNATNDPAYIQFKTALLPPSKEFMNFLNAGHAEQVADTTAMANILGSDSSTPAQIEIALKTLSKSADKRLAELASSYNSTMGVTMPEMLTPKAKDILNRMGTNSEAIPLTVALPKGNGQLVDKNAAKIFLQAAGSDQTLAMEMAKQAGWKVQ